MKANHIFNVVDQHKQKVNDAIQVVRENSPPLECPDCGADESDCVQDGYDNANYPAGGGGAEIVYNYICPKCGKQFRETFYRVLVEKVGD